MSTNRFYQCRSKIGFYYVFVERQDMRVCFFKFSKNHCVTRPQQTGVTSVTEVIATAGKRHIAEVAC